MPDIDITSLRKILELEQKKGYSDSSVFGGLDKFMYNWVQKTAGAINDRSLLTKLRKLGLKNIRYTSLSLKEREKLFSVIARRGFEKDLYSHNEVFDEIRQSPFAVKEAAEYLEVAEINLRRWIKAGNIKHERVGINIVFDADELKAFKRDNWTLKS